MFSSSMDFANLLSYRFFSLIVLKNMAILHECIMSMRSRSS